MTFLEQITEAYKTQKKSEEEEEQKSRSELENRVRDALIELGVIDSFTLNEREVYFDHLTIRSVDGGHKLAWQVQGDCPDCDEMCWSRHVVSLAGIGRMHHAFKTDYNHYCTPRETVTVSENLIDALRQFIESEVEL